jgi:hypothetical protein
LHLTAAQVVSLVAALPRNCGVLVLSNIRLFVRSAAAAADGAGADSR